MDATDGLAVRVASPGTSVASVFEKRDSYHMIIASIGGTTGVGFAEAVEVRDGHIERRGMIRLAGAASAELRALLDRGDTLEYSGPVWADGRWHPDTFPVLAAEAPELSNGSLTLRFVEIRPTAVASRG
jgi:hypothetical protein